MNLSCRLLALLFTLPCAALAADKIKIAVTGPFSGGTGPVGISLRDGARLAVQEANRVGGIMLAGKKYQIDLIERDDEGKNERGALIAQEIASMPDVAAVVGTANTGVILAGDKFYQQAKKPRLITASAGTASMGQWTREGNVVPKDELYMFRFAASDAVQMAAIVEEATVRRGLKRIAILADDTSYGVSGREDVLALLKQVPGVEVVAVEKFSIGTKDMTAQLLKAKAAGATALFAIGVGPELAAIANGMHKLGFRVPMLGSWSLSMSNFLDNAGAAANGALMSQTFIQEDYTPRAKRFIQAYQAAYKVDRIPSPVSAAQGYDGMKLVLAALEQAGSTDGKAVKDALENLQKPVEGAIAKWTRPYSDWNPAQPDSHEAFRKERLVIGVVKNGRVTFANEADKKRLADLDR